MQSKPTVQVLPISSVVYKLLLETSYQLSKELIIQIYSGITSGRVLNGELLYTKILEVNLYAFAFRLFHEDFAYKLFHEDFSPI